jgi:hypothetical protein
MTRELSVHQHIKIQTNIAAIISQNIIMESVMLLVQGISADVLRWYVCMRMSLVWYKSMKVSKSEYKENCVAGIHSIPQGYDAITRASRRQCPIHW